MGAIGAEGPIAGMGGIGGMGRIGRIGRIGANAGRVISRHGSTGCGGAGGAGGSWASASIAGATNIAVITINLLICISLPYNFFFSFSDRGRFSSERTRDPSTRTLNSRPRLSISWRKSSS